MKTWVSGLIISSFVFTVLALLLPNGKTLKSVKTTFGLIFIVLVFTPIVQLKDFDFNVKEFLFDYTPEIQVNYIDFIYQEKEKSLEKNCKLLLEDLGVFNADINLIYKTNDENQFVIDYVEINIKKAVINSENEHINIIEKLKKSVSEYLNINLKNVVIYE